MKIKTTEHYNRIIQGATAILLTEGLAAFSTTKVAKHIQMAQSNIYVYFKNKDDLLVSVFRYHQKKYIQFLVDRIDLSKNLVSTLDEFHSSDKESLDVIWSIRQSTTLRQLIPKVSDDQIFIAIFQWLKDLQHQGTVRQLPLMYLTNLVFSAIIDYFQLIDSKEMSPNELAIEEIVPPLSALLFV
ncbi:TetR/AcrR family transcriptional regulator [Lentilactobacillus buchneri]|nr:TetR/AcrR family transcriptional regulator [Lentilactobacillus sp. Egmn17]